LKADICHNIILEAVDLSKHFVGARSWFAPPVMVHAVDGISLAVRRGETFAIVGESGCGKSTLGRLLLRLLAPSRGRIFYEGTDIGTLDNASMRALRRDLQFIFQDPFSSLNPRLTVGALVEEPLWVHGLADRTERRAQVARLLRRVGLRPGHAERYPHEFSGGQRQRIGIARALASAPKLIIGDEPVSALDVSIQAQIVNLLEDLKEEFGLTLIIIAHDLAIIRHMSDRVAVMYLGEIVELADTTSLYEQPLHPYTQALLGAIPMPSPRGRRAHALLHGDVPSPTAPPPGCRFHTRCPHALARCRVERPKLEMAGGRQVACHRWREIAGEAAGIAAEPEPSPAKQRRFALYRSWRARQENGQRPNDNEKPDPRGVM
jgi:oligopeptide/dipeptide ABC transporter ATP-binding protein